MSARGLGTDDEFPNVLTAKLGEIALEHMGVSDCSGCRGLRLAAQQANKHAEWAIEKLREANNRRHDQKEALHSVMREWGQRADGKKPPSPMQPSDHLSMIQWAFYWRQRTRTAEAAFRKMKFTCCRWCALKFRFLTWWDFRGEK